MNNKKFSKTYYRNICSCCGQTVTKEAKKLPDNNDSEGNLCTKCYEEQDLDNWFRVQEMFDLVTNALTNPISIIKWRYSNPATKYHHCMNLLNKGILTYKIY